MLPDRRRHLVQPATRGARMGAISAPQAITRSSTRRRARLRPRQPARPTSAVSCILPTQVAATFTRLTTLGSTSTPTRSAPASAARSCCAPVRRLSSGRLRHRSASMIAAHWAAHGLPLGAHGVLWGTRGAVWGTPVVLWGTHGVLWGTQVSRIGAQGGARRGTRLDGCARPLCLGARAAAKARKKCSGYSTDRRGYSSSTHDVHQFVLGLFTTPGRGRA